jgi:hypothetical protein
MKYAIEMGSGAVIYISSFVYIGADIQRLIMGRGYTQAQTGWRSHKPALMF